jgi:glycosyltransferase involved in cell wall biosynthesis
MNSNCPNPSDGNDLFGTELFRTKLIQAHSPTFYYQFTVFTPTHNRAHTLHRVYDSLIAQTCSDFEWLVIDDGSTDETRSQITAWQAIAPFPIRYIYQPAQGKHVAYNRAAQEAEGEFLVCLDSDDSCLPYALERMKVRWDALSVYARSRYSGIDCHCMDETGNRIGTAYPRDGFTSNYPEMRYRYQMTGEKWGFQRTVVMRQYPFPEWENSRLPYLPESIVWSPMTVDYPAYYVNECWRVYHQEPEAKAIVSQPSGAGQVTRRNLATQYPLASLLMNQTMLNVDIRQIRFSALTFLKAGMNYNRALWHVHNQLSFEQWREIQASVNTWIGKLLCWVMQPISYLMYRRDLTQR